MKLVFLFSVLVSFSASAETFLYEPYVDAAYGCNYIEGLNYRIPVEAGSAHEAAALVSTQVGQKLTVGCNRDVYQCVHSGGDVEPRPISKETVERSLLVIGGRILSTEGRELVQIGSNYYHRNLRPLPKCKW